MAALVGTDGNPVGPFLYGSIYDLDDTPVVAQVDHLSPAVLQNPAHDIDGRVMPVEK